MNAPVPGPALSGLELTTPAIERLAEALEPDVFALHSPENRALFVPPALDRSRALLAATLNREEMARSVADDLYCQNVTTLMMRHPGESARDQADRIGQWAAEIVLASVLGTTS